MKKGIFSSILFLLFGFSGFAQLTDERMPWQEEPLKWSDFRGTPDPSNPFHANTGSGISYSYSIRTSGTETEFNYEVISYFIPQNSWVKPGKTSEHLLAHEQLHFDITELHARKLRAYLEKVDVNSKNLKKELESLYRQTEKERAEMQKKFDMETRHSQNRELQAGWQEIIREELQKLKDFSS